MIKFISLSFRNFLSFGNNETTIKFDTPGTTLILGRDLDNTADGQGSNGVGKAQPLHCKIKVPNGWKSMGEMRVGDVVSVPDGTSATVTGVFPQGVQPTYRVTFSDGRTTEADKNHLWSVFSHRWGGEKIRGGKILTTEQLQQFVKEATEKNKPWYNISIPRCVHEKISDVNLPIDPYLLGCMLGDGSMTSRSLSFTNTDKQCIETVSRTPKQHHQELVSYTEDLNYKIRCNNNTNTRTNDLADILNELDLLGTNSYNKFIPEVYKNASLSQKLNLIQGLMDTDGTVGKTSNVSFSSSSEQLAKDVQYIIRSMGGRAKITSSHPKYTYHNKLLKGAISYNVSIDYETPQDLFTLTRKKERVCTGKHQYASAGLRITNIEYIGEQKTQCIMIDHPDHLYITDDFIVTHNTAIINALTYAVYDKPVSSISKDNLVNNINKKHMEVSVIFEKDGKTYTIKRSRKMKSGADGNSVHLFEDEKDITVDVNGTNAMIEKIMGISYDLFIRIVVFSASHAPFLELPVTSQSAANQTDIIEGLFDLISLSEKADVLKGMIKEVEQKINMKKIHIGDLEEEHKRYDQQLESAKKRVIQWTQDNEAQITTLQSNLALIQNINIDEQKEYLNLKEGYLNNKLAGEADKKNHQSIIDDHLKKQLHEKNQKIKDINAWVKKLKDDSDARLRENVSLKNKIEHLKAGRCPECRQAFPSTAEKIKEYTDAINNNVALFENIQNTDLSKKHEELDKTTIEIKDLTQEIETENVAIQKAQQLIQEATKELDILNKKLIVRSQDELYKLKNQESILINKIVELKQAENPLLGPLEELENTHLEEINYDEINTLTKKIEHQKFLLKLLTKKDSFVRKVLLNKNIPYLNSRLQYYLTIVGLPHKVEFTHEMVCALTQFGRALDFGNLSAGQQARVNLALSFAFRDVLESLHDQINICLLDEVLDIGLDSIGVQAAARLLKRKAWDEQLSLYIISHRNEIGHSFDKSLVIEMSNGFSSVQES